MNLRNSTSLAVLIIVTLLASACTTYVPVQQGQYQQQPQYQYNPGYDPNNVVAEAIIASAIVNGMTGYYGPGHVFYQQAYYGGVPGYYIGGVFHTNTQYRTTIVNNYNTGRTEFQRNPQAFAQQHPTAVTKPNYGNGGGSNTANQQNNKPNFGQQQGGMVRGAATQQQQSTTTGKPNFGNQNGTMTRGAATQQQQQASAPSKPNFGSGGGGMTRSAPAPAPRSTPSSSSVGRSSRK